MDKKDFEDRHAGGLATRREVLGAAYVDKSMASADDFNREFQELLNTYCWNDIWNRPGLDRPTRSLLNLAMLTALIAGAEAARARRAQQRCLEGRDQGSVPAGRGVLRRAGGRGSVPLRARGLRRVTLSRRDANRPQRVSALESPLVATQRPLERRERRFRIVTPPRVA